MNESVLASLCEGHDVYPIPIDVAAESFAIATSFLKAGCVGTWALTEAQSGAVIGVGALAEVGERSSNQV